jgi:hypothetical protein
LSRFAVGAVLLMMVPVTDAGSWMVPALLGLLRVTVKVSLPSASASGRVGTSTVWVACPSVNCTVTWTTVRSPADALSAAPKVTLKSTLPGAIPPVRVIVKAIVAPSRPVAAVTEYTDGTTPVDGTPSADSNTPGLSLFSPAGVWSGSCGASDGVPPPSGANARFELPDLPSGSRSISGSGEFSGSELPRRPASV